MCMRHGFSFHLALVLSLAAGTGNQGADAPRSPVHLGSTLWRVDGSPRSVRYAPDGKTLLVFGENLIHCLDAADGKVLGRLAMRMTAGHVLVGGPRRSWREPPNWAVSDDCRLLANVGDALDDAHRVVVRNVVTGQLVFEVKDRCSRFTTVQFSPDGKLLAAVQDGTIRVWNLATHKEIGAFARADGKLKFEPWVCTFSPDKRVLAALGADALTVRAIYLWDVGGKNPPRRLDCLTNTDSSYCFSPDGKAIYVATSNRLFVCDPATGKVVRTLPEAQTDYFQIAISPDGKRLALRAQESFRLCDVTTGRELFSLAEQDPKMTFTADSRRLVLVQRDAAARIIDAASGRELHHWKGIRSGESLYDSALSPDGTTLATVGETNVIRRWSLTTGKELPIPDGGDGLAATVGFSPDGKMVAVGSLDGVMLWELSTGKPMRKLTRPRLADDPANDRLSMFARLPSSITYTPDGRQLIAGWSNGALTAWDAASGKSAWAARPHRDPVVALAFSTNGCRVISVARERHALLGYMVQPSPVGHVSTIGPPGAQVPIAAPPPFVWSDLAAGGQRRSLGDVGVPLALSPDGRQALTTVEPGKSRLWELLANKLRLELPAGADFGLARISLDGRLAAVADQKGLTLFDLFTSEQRPCQAAPKQLNDGAFSPDSKLFAAVGNDGVIHVWETATGKRLEKFVGHRARVLALAFSPDGKRLASTGDDAAILLWDTGEIPAPVIPVIAGRTAEARPTLGRARLGELWQQLASDDAARAYQALVQLAQHPVEATALLREQLKPVVQPTDEQLARLIADLDNDSFRVREAAHSTLERLGPLAEAKLRQTLVRGPSAELKARLESLLQRLASRDGPEIAPDQMRVLRAVELLERLGTPEARELLERLSKGAEGALLTEEAKRAVKVSRAGPRTK